MRRYLVAAAAVALAAALPASADDKDEESASVDAPLAVEASGYALYQEDVTALEATPFESLEDIDKGLDVVASYHPDRMARSWIAYASLVAAQSPGFVDGIRQTADYYGRDAVIAGLRNDPSYAGQSVGAEAGRQAVLAAIRNDVARLNEASAAVKERAYSLQSTDWAGARSGDSAKRIARLEEVSLQPRDPSGELVSVLAAPGALGSEQFDDRRKTARLRESFWDAFRLGTAPEVVPADEAPPVSLPMNTAYKNVLDHVVTLAAFEALDSANDADMDALSPLLDQIDTRQCMTMARLEFQQCVAASHFRFEDPFCIAEHGMRDVGGCFAKVIASDAPASDEAAADAEAAPSE
jgi:hypothetical protein